MPILILFDPVFRNGLQSFRPPGALILTIRFCPPALYLALYAVVGGMHLQHSADEKINKIMENMITLNPEYLVPLHCTGLATINKMLNAFKDRVKLLNVGDTFELDE